MQNLGERIVTTARLAAIEHIRQELELLSATTKASADPAATEQTLRDAGLVPAGRLAQQNVPVGFVRRGLERFKFRRTQGAL